jgi:hypothetical protein
MAFKEKLVGLLGLNHVTIEFVANQLGGHMTSFCENIYIRVSSTFNTI